MFAELLLFQGSLVLLILGVGWLCSGLMRRRERRRLKNCNAHGSSQVAGCWPKVTVVMPVKGCRTHSLGNWTSHVGVNYEGQLEFMFVLESEEDAAYQLLRQLACSRPHLDIKIYIAGLSVSCSQKLHNLCAGARAADPASCYVLFLDDDVDLHPTSVTSLVAVMEQDPSLFMATGYPFDIPSPGCSFQTYCMLVYHLPLLIAFSVHQRTQFVWGGVMLLRNKALQNDQYGILKGWLDGGYSDDLILASKCTEHGLQIAVPSFAIFPQWLDEQYTWRQYWNYLHRQLYVLDTYATDHNRIVNHTMMLVHTWASVVFAGGILTAVWMVFNLALYVPSTAWHSRTDSSNSVGFQSTCSIYALVCFLLMAALAQFSLHFMTAEVLLLIHRLSPKRPRLLPSQFSWPQLWAALLLENLLVPACILYTCLVPHVNWAGVCYYKRRGRISAIKRL